MRQDDDFNPGKLKNQQEEPVYFEDQNPYGEDERWWWIFQNPLGVIILVAVAIVLVIGLWFVFQAPSQKSALSRDVVFIKSDAMPYKEAPDESSNPKIQNQDKEVYKRLSQQPAEDEETRPVVKKEESPLEAHEFPETKKEDKAQEPLNQPSALRKVTGNVGVKMPAPAVNDAFIVEKKATPQTAQENHESNPKPATKKADKLDSVAKLNVGNYAIRVASFRKKETAERELQRVFDTLGPSLKGVGRSVKRIESNSGVFYVVTIGAFSSLNKAKQVAALLRERNFEAVIQKVHR